MEPREVDIEKKKEKRSQKEWAGARIYSLWFFFYARAHWASVKQFFRVDFISTKNIRTLHSHPHQKNTKNNKKETGRARDRTGIAGIRNQSDDHYTTQPIFLMYGIPKYAS